MVFPASVAYRVPNSHYIINVITPEIVFTQKKKPAAPYDGVTDFFIMLLGAEIMENHQDNLCSLSAQKYFWLEEPEIIIKIL